MEKIKKVLNLLLILILLWQNAAFCISERKSTLRPPSHFNRATEEFIAGEAEEPEVETLGFGHYRTIYKQGETFEALLKEAKLKCNFPAALAVFEILAAAKKKHIEFHSKNDPPPKDLFHTHFCAEIDSGILRLFGIEAGKPIKGKILMTVKVWIESYYGASRHRNKEDDDSSIDISLAIPGFKSPQHIIIHKKFSFYSSFVEIRTPEASRHPILDALSRYIREKYDNAASPMENSSRRLRNNL